MNVNTNWFFLSSYTVKDEAGDEHILVAKTDTYIRKFDVETESTKKTGQVTFKALHYLGTPIC